MNDEKWIETKREFVIDEFGNERPANVTRELYKPEPEKNWWTKHKDAIDNVIKLIGLVSISIPFVLFYLQQREQNKRDRILSARDRISKQIDIYSTASITIHSLLSDNLPSNQSQSLAFKLFNESYPKLKLFLIDTSDIKDLYFFKEELIVYLKCNSFIAELEELTQEPNLELLENGYEHFDNSNGRRKYPNHTDNIPTAQNLLLDSLTYKTLNLYFKIKGYYYEVIEKTKDSCRIKNSTFSRLSNVAYDYTNLSLFDLTYQNFSKVILYTKKDTINYVIGGFIRNLDSLEVTRQLYSKYMDSLATKLDASFIKINSLTNH